MLNGKVCACGGGLKWKTRCGGTTGWVAFPGVENATPFAGANRGRFEGYARARMGVSVPGRGTPLSAS